ncbi:helix-turn-helix domain-containing protein [Curvibacter gracilis]|uniref:helix-turn-helix domain-containing protein n=1 Tax=Curvibacter gracilis TaxID=230310 RepID=UPI00047F8A61|nr:helix-turn-helix domain-containing protein [Curvibacter gracilis]
MPSTRTPTTALAPHQGLHVDIPLLPRATLGSALTLIDLLRTARMLAQLRLGALAPPISWRLLTAEGGAWPPAPPAASPSASLAALHPALPTLASRFEDYLGSAPPSGQGAIQHAVFLPPMHAADIPSVRSLVRGQGALVAALRQALDAGGLLACQGNSAWLAAATGRAAGRALVLPWFYASAFRDEHPDVMLVADQACVAEAPWFSAAGAEQLGGLVCALLEHSTGPGLAQLCRPAFEFDPERSRAAAQASTQIRKTRDSTLARAIAWLEQHLEAPYDLATLAAAAAVSPRTLLRHFRQELGRSPLDQLHRMRCARARVMLEITLESVPTIALACGYSDPHAFRRVFARHCGCTPSAYREAHALRAPRARWRLDPAQWDKQALL